MDCRGALGVPTPARPGGVPAAEALPKVADGHQPHSAGGCAVESDQTQACAHGHIIEPFTHHETVEHLAAAAQNRPISLHPPGDPDSPGARDFAASPDGMIGGDRSSSSCKGVSGAARTPPSQNIVKHAHIVISRSEFLTGELLLLIYVC